MPNITPSRTMLRVTPSAPPTRPSVPAAADASGVKKSAREPKCRASKTPKRITSITATATSARPERKPPASPMDGVWATVRFWLTASAILIFGPMIRAVVFDFDGLLLDTEEPVYRSWLELYRAHGEELPFESWVQIVGSTTTVFHPQHFLEERLGRPLAQEELDRRVGRRTEMILALSPLPGIVERL